MKKTLTILIVVVMLALMLIGCNQTPVTTESTPESKTETATTPTDTETETATPAELNGEITFWHSFTQGPRLEKIQKAADDFIAENPGVKINIETFSWSDFYTKWTTGLASGNVPDMSSALPTQIVEMIDVDALVSMDDLIDDMGRDKFYESALVEMTKDKACYGIPLYVNTEAMWYRKDLLEKYNLEIPVTWDDLYNAALAITKGENGAVYGCSVPMGMNDLMATRYLTLYVKSAGESLITKEGKANLTSKAAIDGINYWVKMYKECSPADSINFNVLDQATLYYQGKNAFDFNTGFHINGVATNTPDLLEFIDCEAMPRINASDPIVGYESNNTPLVVWKNSKNPEICKAFIKSIFEEDRYVDFLLSVPVGMMSTIKGIEKNEKLLNDPMVKRFQHASEVLYKLVSGSGAIGMDYGPTAKAGLLTSQRVVEEMFQNIILNKVPVEEAAKTAEDKLNDLFSTVD